MPHLPGSAGTRSSSTYRSEYDGGAGILRTVSSVLQGNYLKEGSQRILGQSMDNLRWSTGKATPTSEGDSSEFRDSMFPSHQDFPICLQPHVQGPISSQQMPSVPQQTPSMGGVSTCTAAQVITACHSGSGSQEAQQCSDGS